MDRTAVRFDMIDDATAEVLRQKTKAERLAIAHGMWRSASSLIHSVVRSTYPDWTDAQIQREAARRLSHGAV